MTTETLAIIVIILSVAWLTFHVKRRHDATDKLLRRLLGVLQDEKWAADANREELMQSQAEIMAVLGIGTKKDGT